MVNSRVRSLGWSKEKAITTKPIIRNRNLNKEYLKIAIQNGISMETFAYRVSHKWTLEDAASIQPKDNKKQMSELGKKRRKYSKELIELAESNGIKIRTFYQRVQKYKMNPYEAATKPLIIGIERAMMGKRVAVGNGNLY